MNSWLFPTAQFRHKTFLLNVKSMSSALTHSIWCRFKSYSIFAFGASPNAVFLPHSALENQKLSHNQIMFYTSNFICYFFFVVPSLHHHSLVQRRQRWKWIKESENIKLGADWRTIKSRNSSGTELNALRLALVRVEKNWIFYCLVLVYVLFEVKPSPNAVNINK